MRITALGNALNDHEFHVTESFLEQHSLTKGQMTLASSSEQDQLFHALASAQIQRAKISGGGSAANTVVALASLGAKAGLCCSVADDQGGKFYLEALEEAGVSSSSEAKRAHPESTGSCVVLITPDGERTMQSHLGASADFGVNHLDSELLKATDLLYLEGYLASSPLALEACAAAKKKTPKFAVSFADPAMVRFCKDGLETLLDSKAEYLFCNQVEALEFTQTSSVEAAKEALLKRANTVLITLSEQGALAATAEQTHLIPAPKVPQVLDTNGAGDSFAGAFLFAQTQGLSLDTSTRFAVLVASEVVQKNGPRLTHQQYNNLWKQFD